MPERFHSTFAKPASFAEAAPAAKAEPTKQGRRSIRMRGYDYANEGAYYLTICTHERAHLFGRVTDGVMHPSPLGDSVRRCWDAIPEHMPHVDVGAFVVMPVRCISDHVHGIVVIRERTLDAGSSGAVGVGGVGARHDAPLRDPRKPPGIPRGALGQIVASFKSAVSRAAHDALLPCGTPMWQRNYYERIIRDDGEWERIARYIEMNPANWGKDRFYG